MLKYTKNEETVGFSFNLTYNTAFMTCVCHNYELFRDMNVCMHVSVVIHIYVCVCIDAHT